jgi:hypothetical protein
VKQRREIFLWNFSFRSRLVVRILEILGSNLETVGKSMES